MAADNEPYVIPADIEAELRKVDGRGDLAQIYLRHLCLRAADEIARLRAGAVEYAAKPMTSEVRSEPSVQSWRCRLGTTCQRTHLPRENGVCRCDTPVAPIQAMTTGAAPSVQSRAEVYRNDLFGDPVQPPRKGTTPGGYASPMPGPEGETCATCKWAVRRGHYSKCGHPIQRPRWTRGISTDIRLRTRACIKWEKP